MGKAKTVDTLLLFAVICVRNQKTNYALKHEVFVFAARSEATRKTAEQIVVVAGRGEATLDTASQSFL